jgi:hypothetical protein
VARQPDCVGILLYGRLDDLLGRLVQTGVDDLESRVAKRSCHDLGATIVTIKARLGDDDARLTRHSAVSLTRAARRSFESSAR